MNVALDSLAREVERIVFSTPVDDIHTHLYDPAFGSLLLWGIDDLLVYHYLVAEAFRFHSMPYETFWALRKEEQAEIIWRELFDLRTPISEACQGVITTLHQLGVEPRRGDLSSLRRWFKEWTVEKYTDRCLELAGVRSICMTNSPFDPVERPVWEAGFARDQRFHAALRIDPLLLAWPQTAPLLARWNYRVGAELNPATLAEVRRFLEEETRRMNARYLMVSLPPEFTFPEASHCSTLIEQAVLPHAREFNLPFALMPGVKRGVNPGLRMAGDGLGRSNLQSLENLCAQYPDNKFLCTILSRENQHELCVLARKFRNLHIFGCWWFTNTPSLVDEITRMRLELLGLSFTPQHSDARVLDQLIYKWRHARTAIAGVLSDHYLRLARSGWPATRAEIERDVAELFGGSYARFCRQPASGAPGA